MSSSSPELVSISKQFVILLTVGHLLYFSHEHDYLLSAVDQVGYTASGRAIQAFNIGQRVSPHTGD